MTRPFAALRANGFGPSGQTGSDRQGERVLTLNQTYWLLTLRKRPVCTVLTERRDSCYAASAERSVVLAVIRGTSAATFHGRSSAILLMRCSLMWMIT